MRTTVGRMADGGRVEVEVAVERAWGERRTVRHDLQAGPHLRLAITGAAYGRGCRGPWWSGQIPEAVVEVAEHGEPGRGWDRDRLLRLAALWRRWHSNDLRPGCWHQPRGLSASEGLGAECPAGVSHRADGRPYRWGEEWLLEVLPDAAVLEVVDLFPSLTPEVFEVLPAAMVVVEVKEVPSERLCALRV